MEVAANKNTLAYQMRGRPFTVKTDFSGCKVAAMGKTAKDFIAKRGVTKVLDDAARIYLLNHAVAMIQQRYHENEPLAKEDLDYVQAYQSNGAILGARMLYYVMMICVREARHTPNKGGMKSKISSDICPQTAEFAMSVEDDAGSAMLHFTKHVPEQVTIGNLSKALSVIFYKGGWSGGGFGGPAWGNISDQLIRVAHGELSPEMFCDVAFTLSHNGGPIFNKSMLFSNAPTSNIVKVLDAQRGGFMPAFVLEGGYDCIANTSELKPIAQNMVARWGLPTKVDWAKVKELGGLGDLSAYQEQQTGKGKKGSSGGYIKPDFGGGPVYHGGGGSIPKDGAYKTVGGGKVETNLTVGVTGTVEFWPGTHLQTVTREQAHKMIDGIKEPELAEDDL